MACRKNQFKEINQLSRSTCAASIQSNDNPDDSKTIVSQIGNGYEYWWVLHPRYSIGYGD
ncbi:hypothetical protein N7534_008597 [Penicillium rubens]|nr:hypothetical protein N7534_008597 [Penicillium rubens]